MFELSGRGEDDIGVVGGVGQELVVDDREEIVALKSGDDAGLVGGDHRGVGVVNVKNANRRAGQFAGERLGELVHVDQSGSRRCEVGAGETAVVPVVNPACGE